MAVNKMNIKKIFAGAAAAIMLSSFAGIASAAQPTNPGCVGAAVSGQALAWDGRGEVVSSIAVTGTYGAGVQAYLASNPCGQ
jgi:opacity protein-like surface antigen